MNSRELLIRMSLEEKIDLCCGADFWHTSAFEKYGIPALTVSDGPHGVRYQPEKGDMLGLNQSVKTTCFPTAAATGLSWDRKLVREVGAAIAAEAKSYGVDGLLGPGLNIKRSPLCGRNFEYYSEDPYLAGQLGAAYVKGVQENGVSACPKHFAANSQEYKRFSSDGHMDERTLREIYLPAFEHAIKEGNPKMVMSAYNKINGTYCSDNRQLLTDILREEWGFEGIVITDWGGMHDRVRGFKAGCDLSMPGGGIHHLQEQALRAFRSGTLSMEQIDACAERIIRRALDKAKVKGCADAFDPQAHHELARKAAVQSAVLLKNEGLLPLKAKNVALIGHMAKHPRYQGTGSSRIVPSMLTSLCDAAPSWTYAPGCDGYGDTNDTLLQEAENAAKSAQACVIVAGLPEWMESEGFDRDNMQMPMGHIRLIETVASANPNTVVVLTCGSPVEVPWLHMVKALVYMGLPGQAGGGAILDILLGKMNPGGKLTETWPLYYEDAPCAGCYGRPYHDAQYREGIYVGYRYYETAGIPVRFPFGYGLSYTDFAYTDLCIEGRKVTAIIKNIGAVPGTEVVQLYITPPTGGLHRPVKELKGFERVFLQPGEQAQVTFILKDRSFAVWADGWKVPGGIYGIQLNSSVRDVRLAGSMTVEGEVVPAPAWQPGSWYGHPVGQPPKLDFEAMLGYSVAEYVPPHRGEFTDENTIMEMAEHSFILRLVLYFITKKVARMCGGKPVKRDPTYRMTLSSSADCAIYSLVISACGSMPKQVAYGFIEIANGHILQGIRKMAKC